jgi:hypothetical protein
VWDSNGFRYVEVGWEGGVEIKIFVVKFDRRTSERDVNIGNEEIVEFIWNLNLCYTL